MNDLATRAFIADNSPKIKIEGIEFDEYSTYEGEDEYSPASFICFMTGEGEKAYSYGKETKVISATFHLQRRKKSTSLGDERIIVFGGLDSSWLVERDVL